MKLASAHDSSRLEKDSEDTGDGWTGTTEKSAAFARFSPPAASLLINLPHDELTRHT
jgi:hypothetical protein